MPLDKDKVIARLERTIIRMKAERGVLDDKLDKLRGKLYFIKRIIKNMSPSHLNADDEMRPFIIIEDWNNLHKMVELPAVPPLEKPGK